MTETRAQVKLPDWSITIRRCDNGFIAEWHEEGEDGVLMPHSMVFEEQDSETGELEAMRALFWFIKEHFGVCWSKHDKHSLEIEVKTNKQ